MSLAVGMVGSRDGVRGGAGIAAEGREGENSVGLLRCVLEGFGREPDDVSCAEHVGAPGFEVGGAPEQSIFIGLNTEGIESEVSGEADCTSAVESERDLSCGI